MKDRKRNPDSRKNIVFNIQSIILSVLMAISLVTIIVMGLLLYHRFKLALEKTAVDNTEATVEATVDRLNADLLDIRQILNGANYNVVQQFDISSREFSEQFSLLYETNSDKIQSLALYDPKGNLIASEPVAAEKKNVKVQTQEWYKNAEDAIENIHFSTPHIQELFEDGSYRYQWVVSLSRYVDVNKGETPETGILLLDMKYSVIRDVMKQINDCSGGIYYYLISQDGEMIYHPRGTELNRGLFEENSLEAEKYEDGTYEIRSNGQNETVIVGSVAYTGWKMIGVVPESVQAANYKNFRYYVFATVLVLMVMLLEGNQLVSRKISKPIRELDASVKAHEAGGKPDIYIGGSSEIRHLGHSVQKSYEQIEKLMDEIIRQQNERRKSELDALQSQINPHFLYNTLESITWMVEAQENEAAVRMIDYCFTTEGSLMVRSGPEDGVWGGEGGWHIEKDEAGNELYSVITYDTEKYTSYYNFREQHSPMGMPYNSSDYMGFVMTAGDPKAGWSFQRRIDTRPVPNLEINYPLVMFTADEQDVINTCLTDMRNYVSSMEVKFITGEADIDGTWEEYIKTLNKMGMDKVIAAKQAAYDRYTAK